MLEQRKRNLQIYKQKEAGETYPHLAVKFNLSEVRIYQIVKDVRIKIALNKIAIDNEEKKK